MSFAVLLQDLVAQTPGARGAVLCSFDGEFVDLVIAEPQPGGCGPLSAYDLKLFGAQVAPTWTLLRNGALQGAGAVLELRVLCPGGTLLCRNLRDGYYLVLLLAPGTLTSGAGLALERAAVRVLAEL